MNPTPGPWDPPAAIPGGNLGGPTGGGGGVPVQRHASQELYQGSFGAPGGVAGEGFGGGGGGPGGGGGGPGFDSFANEMIGNNAAAQMGLRYGKDMVQSSLGKYLPGAHLAWDSLKGYFLVDNKYVTTKMKLLLFPYRQKAWERRPAGSGGFASPIDDPMAPDLYIPVMAGCTYVILVGLAKGSNLKFSPDVLVDVATTCIVTQLVEVAIFKAGMHIFAERPHFTPSFLDLVAYTGYKYVALVINILAGLTLGWMAYYFSLAVNGIAMFAFVVRRIAGGARATYTCGGFFIDGDAGNVKK